MMGGAQGGSLRGREDAWAGGTGMRSLRSRGGHCVSHMVGMRSLRSPVSRD